MTDKATEGRTEAAAVDQAIADVEHWVREQTNPLSNPRSRTEAKERGRAALRVLADAVEAENVRLQVALDNGDRLLSQCGRETDRLARQVADLEAALEELKQWALGSTTGRVSANGVEIRARAALAAARARDPQEGA